MIRIDSNCLLSGIDWNKLCARPHDMPLAPVCRMLQPSSSPYTPYACGALHILCHVYSWLTGSGSLWLWLWCCQFKLCSDLNSQPKRPGDLDLWPWKWCPSHVWRGLTWAILVFLGLSVLKLGPIYATDVRQTDVRQNHCLMPPSVRGSGITTMRYVSSVHIKQLRAQSRFQSQWKSAWRRRKHCALAVVRRSQKFRPTADPLPGGVGRPKCNQL